MGKAIKGKLQNRGKPVMYLGRAAQHTPDTYRLLNLETQQIIRERGGIWLNKVYGEYKGSSKKRTDDMIGSVPEALMDVGELPDHIPSSDPEYQDVGGQVAEAPQQVLQRARTQEVLQDPVGGVKTRRGRSLSREDMSTLCEALDKTNKRLGMRYRSSKERPRSSAPRGRSKTPTRVLEVETPQESDPVAQRMLEQLAGIQSPANDSIADRVRAMQATINAPQDQSGREEAPGGGVEETKDDIGLLVSSYAMIDRFGDNFDVLLSSEVAFKANAMLMEDYEKMDPSKYKEVFEKPENFKAAWDHEEPFQKEKWQEAITKELDKMKLRKVWRKIKRSQKPQNRRCVKHKWVFEIKQNGIFCARLVACGYSQVAGIDFQEIYSPVANDITFRILLIYLLMNGCDSLIFDIETAFLMGDLDEEIYMDCPEGMDHEDDKCLILDKTIYGLVQSARQYFKKFASIVVDKLGFKQCQSDPCLFMKKDANGVCIILVYVDDCLAVGDRKAIDAALKGIKENGFSMTVSEELSDYLSCEIKFSKDKKKAWVGQPHMIKKIEKTFGEEVTGMQKYQTPGTPGQGLVRTKNQEDKIDPSKHSRYCTGVGMLLFMIKHSRPDMCNSVRELTKCLDGATAASYKEMLRNIKFLLDTRSKGLKIFPKVGEKTSWYVVLFSDSDWAGDKDDRKSVGGYMLFLNGVLVSWRSRSQKVVSLSSSEAEFYACSEAVKEIPFIVQILLFMGIPVELPIPVWVDNVGAIFMSENATSSSRTRHMDTRFRYVTQLQDEGLIKIMFVPTAKNLADGCTKNVSKEIQEEHTKEYLVEKDEVE